jgi:hypothetical protein
VIAAMVADDMVHRQSYDPAHPLAFLHIPKCAGSSLTEALDAALKPRTSFAAGAIDCCMFGDFAFECLQETARRTVVFDAVAIPQGVDFLAGHLSLSMMSQASPHAQFMTVLREPTSRLISLWLYLRSLPPSFHEHWQPWSNVIRLCHQPLREFLKSIRIACQTDNQTVRLLLWPHRLIPNGGFIDERHDERLVDEARSRLERFSFVDVVENPTLPENIAAWLERPFVLNKFNETEGRPVSLETPLADELDPETSARLASLSRLDAVLWSSIATQRLQGVDCQVLRAQTIARNLSHYSRLAAQSG